MMDQATVSKLVKIERRLDGQKTPERSSDLISPFLALPGLRAFWPMSALDYTNPQARDIAGGGYHLTNNNTATFGYDPTQVLAPCVFFDGVNQYLSRADGGAANWADITGTETYIENTIVGARGLTWGGWFYPANSGVFQAVMGKWGGAGQRSYNMYFSAADVWGVQLSDDGTNFSSAASTAQAVNNWYFVVGRFDPAVTIEVCYNGAWVSQATARASAFDSTTALDVGASGAGSNPFQGRASLCFLCAAYLDDATISSLFQQTRGAFGV